MKHFGRALLAAAISLVSGSSPAFADVLYALTYDGYLVAIDTTTAVGTRVRTRLPSSYGHFGSVEYVNGYFYATYDMPTRTNVGNAAAAQLLRFGFSGGDEVALGNFGITNLSGLGATPAGALYGTLSNAIPTPGLANSSSHYIGILNTSNQTYSLQPGAFGTSAPTDYSHFAISTSVTFKDNTTEYVISPYLDSPGVRVRLAKLTYANNVWSVVRNQDVVVSNTVQGLAFDRSTSNTLYAASGWAQYTNTGPYDSFLQRIVEGSSSYSSTLVGEIDGYPGVVGLTFAPLSPCLANGFTLERTEQNATVSGSLTVEAGLTLSAGNFGGGNYTVDNGATVQFVAGEQVNLAPGFSVRNGAAFDAQVDPSVCI